MSRGSFGSLLIDRFSHIILYIQHVMCDRYSVAYRGLNFPLLVTHEPNSAVGYGTWAYRGSFAIH